MRQPTNHKLPPLWAAFLDALAAGHPAAPIWEGGQITAYRCLGSTFGLTVVLTLIRWRYVAYTDAPRGEIAITPLGVRGLERDRRRAETRQPSRRAPRNHARKIPPPLQPGARPAPSAEGYTADPVASEAAYAHAILSARYWIAADPDNATGDAPSASERALHASTRLAEAARTYSSAMASVANIIADYRKGPAVGVAWLRRQLDTVTGA